VKRFLLIGVAFVVAVGVAAPLSALAAGGKARAQTASVKITDFKFASAQLKPAPFGKESILKPGPTTITFTNSGKFAHDFTIIRTSKGATKFTSGVIAVGKSKQMTVNLKPGAYLAACTQFNGEHFASGMVTVFTVGKIDGTTGAWGP
jgi:plastocyanin